MSGLGVENNTTIEAILDRGHIKLSSKVTCAANTVLSVCVAGPWTKVVKSLIGSCLDHVVSLDEGKVSAPDGVARPETWLALAALCMVESSDVKVAKKDVVSSQKDPVSYCANCEDEKTLAQYFCETCQTKCCGSCDEVLHKNLIKRLHIRTQINAGEISAMTIERTETTARAQMSGLMIIINHYLYLNMTMITCKKILI